MQSLHKRTYERNTDFQNFIQRSRLEFRPCSDFKKAYLDDRQKLYQQLAKRIWNPDRLRVPHGEEPEITFDFDSDLQQGPETPDKVWTIDKVVESIPQERREHYETHHTSKVAPLYIRVAELLNLVQEKDWLLTPRFRHSYCALYLERRPIFGVNFFGAPRFAIWISRKEAERLSNHCKFERYDDQHRHAVYPRHTLVDELHPIFEIAYSVAIDKLSEGETTIARARQALLEHGQTQEEIDEIFY